jgi:hypothetical protein
VTTIRPPRLDRVLSVIVFGPVGIGTGVAVASVAFSPGASARAFVFVLGLVLAAIAITTVLDDAFVEWRDDDGTEHRRQIWMLTQAWEDDGTKFAPLWRWRRAALLEVRAWAGARAV